MEYICENHASQNMNIPAFLDLIPEMLELCITNDSMNKNSKKNNAKFCLNFT